MTELQRYLAEEIAEDHADGLVSRREALRRLGLLGLSGATAASLLAGIVADEARARMRAHRRRGGAGSECGGRRDGGAADSRDRVSRAGGSEAHGCVGGGRSASRRRVGDPREPRAQRLDPCCGGPPGREWLLVAGDRPVVGGGRDRVVRGRVRSDGGARSGSAFAIRGGHEGGRDGASPSAPREEGRGDRVLLRWRDDVAAARLEGVAPGGCRSVLRPLPRGREPRGRQGRRARDLCGARLEGQRQPRRRRVRRSGRPDFGTRSSRTRASTTRSSTRPGRDTIRPRPRPPIAGCWPGSARTLRT